MVEREQAHRIKMQQDGLNAGIREARLGMWAGIAISFLAIAGAVYLAAFHAAIVVPVALVSLPVMSVVVAFVKRRRS